MDLVGLSIDDTIQTGLLQRAVTLLKLGGYFNPLVSRAGRLGSNQTLVARVSTGLPLRFLRRSHTMHAAETCVCFCQHQAWSIVESWRLFIAIAIFVVTVTVSRSTMMRRSPGVGGALRPRSSASTPTCLLYNGNNRQDKGPDHSSHPDSLHIRYTQLHRQTPAWRCPDSCGRHYEPGQPFRGLWPVPTERNPSEACLRNIQLSKAVKWLEGLQYEAKIIIAGAFRCSNRWLAQVLC